MDGQMAAAMAEVEEAMRQKMAEVERQHATRIKKVEAHGAEKLREAEEAGKRAEKTHVKATVDLRKTMEEQRSKAVRLEIAKWQRVGGEGGRGGGVIRKDGWQLTVLLCSGRRRPFRRQSSRWRRRRRPRGSVAWTRGTPRPSTRRRSCRSQGRWRSAR